MTLFLNCKSDQVTPRGSPSMVPIMLRMKRQHPNITYKVLHDLPTCPTPLFQPTLQPSPVTCISQMSPALLALDLSHVVESAWIVLLTLCRVSTRASALPRSLPNPDSAPLPCPESPRPLPAIHPCLTALVTAVFQSTAHLSLLLFFF